MSRSVSLVLFLVGIVAGGNAQNHTGYFGKKFFIGWENSARISGLGQRVLVGTGIGIGTIRLEKLVTRNRMLGLSYGRHSFAINDASKNYQLFKTPTRYLNTKSYTAYVRWFSKSNGIAPVGNYVTLSFSGNKHSIDSSKASIARSSFGDYSMGFEMGRAFALIGNRLIANFSIGLNLRLTQSANRREDYTQNFYSNFELNQASYSKNLLKANFGISCALF